MFSYQIMHKISFKWLNLVGNRDIGRLSALEQCLFAECLWWTRRREGEIETFRLLSGIGILRKITTRLVPPLTFYSFSHPPPIFANLLVSDELYFHHLHLELHLYYPLQSHTLELKANFHPKSPILGLCFLNMISLSPSWIVRLFPLQNLSRLH